MSFTFGGLNLFGLLLGIFCLLLGAIALYFQHKNKILSVENKSLHKQVIDLSKQFEELLLKYQESQEKLKRFEGTKGISDDNHLKEVVDWLVGLKVSGLVLLVAMNFSGYAGGAAIVTALAMLGGPAGMMGGISLLVLLPPAYVVLKKYGLPKLWKLVVDGLIDKGFSIEEIKKQICKYPKWIIGDNLRNEIVKTVLENK
jgi:hypothetical protein